MDFIWWLVLITLLSGVVGTGLGGAVGAVLGRDSNRVVSLLLSFAGGVMLAVVCFDLIVSAIEPQGAEEPMSIFLVIGGVLLGFGVIYILNWLIDRSTNHELTHVDDEHPKTADDLGELIHADHYSEHKRRNYQLFVAGVVMAFAIALHNFPEGMVIGAAYAGQTDASIFSGTGLVLAVLIGLHNIPEGMAVSVPLIAGGEHKGRAVLITALSGFPTVLGAVLGYYLGLIGPIWLCLSLAFASGAMLYVVFGELLPEAILMYRSKAPAFAIIVGIAVGLIIIYA